MVEHQPSKLDTWVRFPSPAFCTSGSVIPITRFLHEWLSGGVSPCQGEGRGFESRLVLFLFFGNRRNTGFPIFLCPQILETLGDTFFIMLFRLNQMFLLLLKDYKDKIMLSSVHYVRVVL